MSRRGPKARTPRNERPAFRFADVNLEPTCELGEVGKAEFKRLVAVLWERDLLDRAEVGHISQAARMKEWVDKVCKAEDAREAAMLLSQLRGLHRELGLTLQPSKGVGRSKALPEPIEAEDDLVAGRIKLSG
jgi:hypothetical protein